MMAGSLILAPLCLLLVLGQALAAPQSHIVGGTDVTQPDKWPWQASLQHYSTHICGAVLISPQWIVTAAYCVHEPISPAYTALFGVLDLFGEKQGEPRRYNVVQAIRHPGYEFGVAVNDISLMNLERPVDLDSALVKPISLPASISENFTSSECYLTGWGALDGNGLHPHADILQEVDVDVFSHYECQRRYTEIQTSHICAGRSDNGAAACLGDSGSPLSCRVNGVWKLAGIGSGEVRACTPTMPSMYTRTSSFLAWIQQQTTM